MFVLRSISVCAILLIALCSAEDFQTQGYRAVMRVYDECQRADGGFTPCLKKKAIAFIDRATKIDLINIDEGLSVVRNGPTDLIDSQKVLSEAELEQTLPRGFEARDEALSNLLIDKIAHFFNGRMIQVNLPKMSSDDIGRGLEEGRGKMKKMMGMMMMGFAMKMAALIPVAIAFLYLLAGKALIISKIALLLAGILGIKKLLSSNSQSSSHSSGWSSSGGSGGWSSGGGGGGGGGGHGSGGWDRRSNEAQELAYRGYPAQQMK